MFRYFRKKKTATVVAAVMTEYTYALDAMLLRAGVGNGVFVDSSQNASVFTPSVAPRLSSKSPVSGGTSCKFRSAQGDYLIASLTASNAFGTGDFTIEYWIYPNSSTSQNINSFQPGNSSIPFADDIISGVYRFRRVDTGSVLYAGSRIIPVKAWTHIAVVRQNGVISVYFNGTLDGTVNDTTNWGLNSSYQFAIGAGIDGYISNLHHTKVAKYTGEFIPSTDPYVTPDGNTVLLMKFDTMEINETTGNSSVYSSSATKYSTSVKKFTGNTFQFDGTNYFQMDAVNLTGDFTVEMWVYQTARTTALTPLISQWQQTTGYCGWEIVLGTTGLIQFWWGASSEAAALVSSASAVPLNTWTHIAVSRVGRTVYIFINGSISATATMAVTIMGRPAESVPVVLGNCIANSGSPPGTTVSYFKGYMDDIHITKDYAKYIGPFDVPTDYVSTGNGYRVSGGDPYYAMTPIHLKFNDKAVVLSYINDGKSDQMTNSGVTFSSARSNFYPNSAYFTGSTYISYTREHLRMWLEDFTIEGWFNWSDLTGIQYLFDCAASTGAIAPAVYKNGNNVIRFQTSNSTNVIYGTTVIQANTWYHIAVCRYAGVTRLFINGNQEGSNYIDTNGYVTNAGGLIGNARSSQTIGFRGYMSDFRMTLAGRYRGPFVAPTAAFPDYWDYDTDKNWSRSVAVNVADTTMKVRSNAIRNKVDKSVLTITGNAGQGGINPYRENYSVYIPASGGISVPYNSSYNLGSSDFSLEFMFRFDNNGTPSKILTWSAGGFEISTNSNGSLLLYMGSTASSWNMMNGVPFCGYIEKSRWYHVAITREGNTLRTFIDGSLTTTTTISGSIYNASSAVSFSTDGIFIGLVSNLRMIVGKCTYNDYFWPKYQKLTAVDGTVLLLAQSRKFEDVSSIGAVVTRTGAVVISTVSPVKEAYIPGQRKGSLSFDGTGDKLTTGVIAGLYLGSTFEIDTWVYLKALPTVECRFALIGTNATSSALAVSITTTGAVKIIVPNTGATGLTTAAGVVNYGEWVHLAIAVLNGVATIYKNGVAVASGTITTQTSATTNTLTVGYDTTTSYTGQLQGFLSDFRISNTIRHTADFLLPAAPISTDDSTVVLLQGDEAAVYERNAMANLDLVGTVTATPEGPYNGVMTFNGAVGSYARLPYSPDTNAIGNGNFTIEFWMNLTTVPTNYSCMFSIGTTQVRFGNSTYSYYLQCTVTNASSAVIYSTTLTQALAKNSWLHVAMVRKDGYITMYVNGHLVAIKSAVSYNDVNSVPASDMWIGSASGLNGFNGLIKDVKVSSFARYLSNFVPPVRKSAQV